MIASPLAGVTFTEPWVPVPVATPGASTTLPPFWFVPTPADAFTVAFAPAAVPAEAPAVREATPPTPDVAAPPVTTTSPPVVLEPAPPVMLTALPAAAAGVDIVWPEIVSVVLRSAAAVDPFHVAMALSVEVAAGPPT